ncbi:MAG: hypothetical protein ACR2QV_02715 [Gammaproteobacteria bacterium]
MKRLLPSVAAAGTVALAGIVGTIAPVDGAYAGKARGQLYSTAAVNRFCKGAQGIIANTILEPNNVLFGELGMAGIPFPPPGTPATGFIGSDAAPWDGNEGAPLTTTQFVGYGIDSAGKDYPQTIMCKMKSWDAIEFYYGPGAAADGASCSDINADTYARVLNSLTNPNQEPEVVTEVVFDEWVTFTGQQWTSEAPATTAYTSTADGKVHIVGKPLYVARTNPSPFVGPEKKGVHYCQIIAPEYLREIIVGNIVAPTCDAPPAYAPPAGPPAPPPIWGCANP